MAKANANAASTLKMTQKYRAIVIRSSVNADLPEMLRNSCFRPSDNVRKPLN